MSFLGSSPKVKRVRYTPQSSIPLNPTEGDVYYSDGTSSAEGLYVYKNSAWEAVGASGANGINYIENSDAESATTGWATYADAAATTPVDGTAGSASALTFSRNTSSPLRGVADFDIAKSAANGQGQGVSYDFTIDSADKAKKLVISFDYTTSANYADDDIKVFIYDVTNATIIRINGEDLKANSSNATHYAQFQTSSNSVSYRLILHVSSTNATAYDVNFDNVSVGPTNLAFGAIVTDWESFTPTSSWVANTTVTGKYQRVGDSINLQVKHTLTGAPTSATLTFDLPAGFTFDTAKMVSSTTGTDDFGRCYIFDATGATYTGILTYEDTNSIRVRYITTSTAEATVGSVNATVPFTFATGDIIISHIRGLPIQGWSSNALMSQDLGGREIVVEGAGNGGTALTADVTNIDFTETRDTTASWNGTEFTAPETKTYIISGVVQYTSNITGRLESYIDGTLKHRIGEQINTESRGIFSDQVYLTKGQVWSLRSSTSVTLSNVAGSHWISIAALASPQTMLETETVAMTYSSNSGQSIANATSQTVVFEDIRYDTHNAYNTSTGDFTVPVSGYYRVSSMVNYAATGTGLRLMYLTKNNGTYLLLDQILVPGSITGHGGVASINAYKGDTLQIIIYQNEGGSKALSTDGTTTFISIERIK